MILISTFDYEQIKKDTKNRLKVDGEILKEIK
jgi:hypothetical protein